jgi:hypothetical protein
MEAIRDNWDAISDETGYFVPHTTAEHAAMRASLSL